MDIDDLFVLPAMLCNEWENNTSLNKTELQ